MLLSKKLTIDIINYTNRTIGYEPKIIMNPAIRDQVVQELGGKNELAQYMGCRIQIDPTVESWKLVQEA